MVGRALLDTAKFLEDLRDWNDEECVARGVPADENFIVSDAMKNGVQKYTAATQATFQAGRDASLKVDEVLTKAGVEPLAKHKRGFDVSCDILQLALALINVNELLVDGKLEPTVERLSVCTAQVYQFMFSDVWR